MTFPNWWFCLIRLVRCPVLLAFIQSAVGTVQMVHQECGEISPNRKSPELLNCDSGAGPKVDGSSQGRGWRSGTYDIIESLSNNNNQKHLTGLLPITCVKGGSLYGRDWGAKSLLPNIVNN